MTQQPVSTPNVTRHQDVLFGRAFATRRDVVAYALTATFAASAIFATSATGHAAAFSTVTSADGTKIAFERRGSGPALILIGGGLNDRAMASPLADSLAGDLSVYTYDRRGRGDSTDTAPYTVAREVEDLAALIGAIGVPVSIFGHSSGAILALEAAAAKLPIVKLAVYEPPFNIDAKGDADSQALAVDVAALLKVGKHEETVTFFLTGIGMPPQMIAEVKKSPMWSTFVSLAPTLNYDLAIVHNGGTSHVPTDRINTISVPVVAIAGGESPEGMKQAAQAVAKASQHGQYQEMAGQTHYAPPEVIAPLLKAFFS